MIRTVLFAVVKKILHKVVVRLESAPAAAPFKKREHISGYLFLTLLTPASIPLAIASK